MKNKVNVSAGAVKIRCLIYEAETFLDRLKGLMFCKHKCGLFIKNCSSIHTCFMKFDIDVICLDKDYKTVEVFYGVKPFRFAVSFKKTQHILELPLGILDKSLIKPEISLKIFK